MKMENPLWKLHITSHRNYGKCFNGDNRTGRKIFNYECYRKMLQSYSSCRGYKQVSLKPDFQKEMTVKMERDPEYKAPESTPGSNFTSAQDQNHLLLWMV